MELLEKSFSKEQTIEEQGQKTHMKRMGSIDNQISKLDKENKKLQLSASSRPSRLLRMQTTSEELEKLKETKEKQEQMFLVQKEAKSLHLQDSRVKTFDRRQKEWNLENKKFTYKLVFEYHKKQKEQFFTRQHSNDLKQLEKEIVIWKNKMIQLLLGEDMTLGQVTEKVCKMIEGYRTDLHRVHGLELKCFEETSEDILLSLDKEMQEMTIQLDSVSSLDSDLPAVVEDNPRSQTPED